MTFRLRPWSGVSELPRFGRFQVNFEPDKAHVFLDGEAKARGSLVRGGLAVTRAPAGRHVVEVRWPDGRRATKEFRLAGGNTPHGHPQG